MVTEVAIPIVFVGDVGTEISLDCGVDVSTATVRKILVYKYASRVRLAWDAVADGPYAIKYVTTAGDIDVEGSWELQSYIEMPGWKGFGAKARIDVGHPLLFL